MNDDATINENGGKFAGMDRYEARAAIVKELDEMGLLVGIEDYSHNVGTHDRCKTTVEPLIKKQWFVKMDELIKPAVEGVKNGDIRLIPERMDKTYYNWTDNIRDWCISRQLWWGHRIPAYYCQDCGETVVAKEAPHTCPKCGGSILNRMRIRWIPGFLLLYGPSPLLDGQRTQKIWITSIPQMSGNGI
mgnify:CR=1 FL=1